jgi:hypothetical protein
MKLFLIACSSAAFTFLAVGQTSLIVEKTALENTYKIKWDSIDGRSYFIQHSNDLVTWNYVPKVMAGINAEDWMGVASTADKHFFRLLWSSLPTYDPLTADHDGDGIPSYAELTVTHTDPLKFSTAGNGVSDRGLFPSPSSGVYTDAANRVQYLLVPNPSGVPGHRRIIAIRNFESPNYDIRFKKGERQLGKKGYSEFIGTSTKRFLTKDRYFAVTDGSANWISGNWQYGETQGTSYPSLTRYVITDYLNGFTDKVAPYAGTETTTGVGFENAVYAANGLPPQGNWLNQTGTSRLI